jgi:UDP-N-acetylglucosamine--N-acetylmuramyl-(pentapeptide) pyrophosphoryl-undecaprenol N-acetylglucosamine transferase
MGIMGDTELKYNLDPTKSSSDLINHSLQESKVAKRVIIAGGGTGGHIFPAIAIANALKLVMPNIDILFIGAKGKMEMEKVPEAGYAIKGLDIAGFNRSSIFKNISLPVKLLKSFIQVKNIFKSYLPDAVIGVGGYSTFPVLRYAQAKGIPTFIHESNSHAGKANMLLGKKATEIFVAVDGMNRFFPSDKIKITGNPIRKDITGNKMSKEDALKHFGLNYNKITVLVIGGSLGAKSINEAISASTGDFIENNLQLIWQTGKIDSIKYKAAANGKSDIYVSEFIKLMGIAYIAADIVISRSGAMSVSELCVSGKPTVFVPFPFAAEDHQTVNARYLVDRNAALMVKDSEVDQKLCKTVIELAKNRDLQYSLHKNINVFAVVNADEIIANEILKFIK